MILIVDCPGGYQLIDPQDHDLDLIVEALTICRSPVVGTFSRLDPGSSVVPLGVEDFLQPDTIWEHRHKLSAEAFALFVVTWEAHGDLGPAIYKNRFIEFAEKHHGKGFRSLVRRHSGKMRKGAP